MGKDKPRESHVGPWESITLAVPKLQQTADIDPERS
jgi:hypothetical protein